MASLRFHEIKLRAAARGALPDSAGQPIILNDRGRRFPTARWISPFSIAGVNFGPAWHCKIIGGMLTGQLTHNSSFLICNSLQQFNQ